MNILHKCICISLALSSIQAASAFEWKDNSVLASGRWVEIRVEGRGLRKISFDLLRDMGFENPSSVKVYGRTGMQLPLAFADKDGMLLQPDDLSPIGCAVRENALYFYSTGVDGFDFASDPDSPTGGAFIHTGKNIYANQTTYFLTDTSSGLTVATSEPQNGTDYIPESNGLALIYHEEDLAQNDNGNGQLFWGETFPADGSRLEWHYCLPGSQGFPAEMQYSLHIESEQSTGPQGSYSFGVMPGSGASETGTSHAPTRNKTSYHAAQKTEPFIFTMPADEGFVFASYDRGGSDCNVANLDWWSVTAQFDISRRLNAAEPQFEFAIPSNGRTHVMTASSAGTETWDITDPLKPIALPGNADQDSVLVDFQGSDHRNLIVFHPQSDLPGFSSWQPIENQNLHAAASEGAEFAIISLPWLLDKAQEIAALHEKEMGQKCIVASTEQVYREYGGGMPDPMAYRNFARMLYDSPVRLKNLLLFGTLTADARGVRAAPGRGERIISYQKSLSSKHDGAMSDVDVYGIMDSRLSASSNLESMTVDVGVGILPVSSAAEAASYIDKLKRHLSGEGLELHIADHLLIGCDGDNHQHEVQCEGVRQQLDMQGCGFRHVPVYNDLMGTAAARLKIIETLNSGTGLATYIGHGGCLLLTKESGHFGYPDLKYVRNELTPFMFFAACNITNGDMGQRGMSEQMVVGDRFGLIGAVTSNRTAMSVSNYDLTKTFYSELYPKAQGNGEKPLSITVGEAYAKTKSIVKSYNELAFQLMSDPAIMIPMPAYKMTDPDTDISIGRMNTLSGEVIQSDGKRIDDFNGKAAVRILLPGAASVFTGVISGTEGPAVKDEDIVLATGVGLVENGRYTVALAPGSACIPYSDENLKIMVTAYDPVLRLGASSSFSRKLSKVNTPEGDNENYSDITPPTLVSAEYDNSRNALIITTSDDTALDLSSSYLSQGFSVDIDGKALLPQYLGNVEFLPDASRCRHTIYLASPEAGGHTAAVKMSDVAGNKAICQTSFTVDGDNDEIRIYADCHHTQRKIEFVIDSNLPSERMTIHIADMTGKKLLSVNADGATVTVDTGKIPSGTAIAYCEDRETGKRSNTLTLPIIKPESSR